ncbi:MAG: hypothetical protein KDA41_14035, partial [Planctomycetales bacterium]|nr:hypothetical protein [Planctomycetales bacterium]
LSPKVASFVEIYGSAIPTADIPRVDVLFSNLRVNGKLIAAPGASAHYPSGVPDFAAARAEGNGVLVRVGEEVPDRRNRVERIRP